MTARVETQWVGATGLVDFVVTYPTGGTDYDVTVATECDTHSALATAMQAAITAVVPGTWVCTVSGTTGAFHIQCTTNDFDVAFNEPFATFCSLSDESNTNRVDGGAYPPSQFRSLCPVPKPHPRWDLVRPTTVTDGGRVRSALQAVHPIQPIELWFGPTDQTWDDLMEWLGYAGSRFSLFRSTDTSLYTIVNGTPNPDGRSLCRLTRESRRMVRQWPESQRHVHGWVSLQARLLEGY